MIIFCITLVFLSVNAVQVKVEGDITIDLNIGDAKYNQIEEKAKDNQIEEKTKETDDEGGKKMKANSDRDVSSEQEESLKKAKMRKRKDRYSMVTKAVALECVYQFPETSQVEAMLSNMMNQLAKVYVRVQDFVGGDSRRRSARFRVVNSKNHTYFDEIYGNMTQEYRKLFNTTSWWVPRTSDPCDIQPELKNVWSHLIDSSIQYLRQAVTSSVGNFLSNKLLSLRKRSDVDNLVEKELARVRTAQLNTLCDDFQLCFNELVTENSTSLEKQSASQENLGGSQERRGISQETLNEIQEKQNISQENLGGNQEKIQEKLGNSHEKRNIGQEIQGVSQEKQAVSHEKQGESQEKRNFSHETQIISQERQGVSKEKQGVSQEKQGESQDQRNASHETQNTNQENQGVSQEKHSLSGEKQSNKVVRRTLMPNPLVKLY